MKKNLKFSLCLLIAVFSLFSCQKEENETRIGEEEALSKSAPLTTLLKRVAMVDVSSDNIIDSTSCFKVQLPVDVLVNNQPVHIDSEEDFATVEHILATTDPVEVSVDLVFPVKVIYPDYSEVTVVSQEQFDLLKYECVSTVPVDNQPVSCFSIVYPITIYGYATAVQQAQTYTIDSDIELFTFLFDLSADEYFEISYPVSIVNEEGETIVIHGNSECEQAILAAIDFCSENNPVACESAYKPFLDAYSSIATIFGVAETTIWSAQTHEYTFSLSSAGTICTIGYEADLNGGPYKLEILASGAGTITGNDTLLYSGIHTFAPSELKYVSITPVAVNANQKYIVRRSNAIGGGLCKALRKIEGLDPILPATQGAITIHSARFFGGGTGSLEQDYHHVPFISFGFTPN